MKHLICFHVLFSAGLSGVCIAYKERLNCEPKINLPLNYWRKNYNFTTIQAGFVVNLFHESKQTYPDIPVGFVQKQFNENSVHAYIQLLNLRSTGILQPFRASPYIIVYNFYGGDSVIIHQFNSKTGEYKKEELGYHTRKYMVVLDKEIIQVTEFPNHGVRGDNFVNLGVTLVSGSANISYQHYITKDEMLENFPQHTNLINSLKLDLYRPAESSTKCKKCT